VTGHRHQLHRRVPACLDRLEVLAAIQL